MFRSIRWALQAWHACILVLAIVGFGVVLDYMTHHWRLRQTDTELQGAAQGVASHRGPPRRPQPPPPRFQGQDDLPPEDGGPPPGRRGPRPRDGQGRPFPPPEGPPGRGGFPDDQPPPRPGQGGGLQLPPDLSRRFDGKDIDGSYYAVWNVQGDLLFSSTGGVNVPTPGPLSSQSQRPSRPEFRSRGPLREVLLTDPQGSRILVGRSTAREGVERRQMIWLLVLSGAAVTAIGLLGGWLLSRQVIRPIAAMTDAARSISAENFSRRIDAGATRNELTELALVLNGAFDRLESAYQQQVRFTADASHELRTPLSVIHSQAELALSRERSAPEYRQTIEACLRAARRMKSLAESLLTLARADAGKLELKHETFDLRETVTDCVEMLGPLAEEKNVSVETDLNAAVVRGDAFRLAQVVTNLLTNAIVYNREGGKVKLTLREADRSAILTIADTGVGIPADDCPHLFERFYRVDKARSRHVGGNGLGLAICKSVVDAHSGTITFESVAGEGTTFRVTLGGNCELRIMNSE